jgi:hypothetical protein
MNALGNRYEQEPALRSRAEDSVLGSPEMAIVEVWYGDHIDAFELLPRMDELRTGRALPHLPDRLDLLTPVLPTMVSQRLKEGKEKRQRT